MSMRPRSTARLLSVSGKGRGLTVEMHTCVAPLWSAPSRHARWSQGAASSSGAVARQTSSVAGSRVPYTVRMNSSGVIPEGLNLTEASLYSSDTFPIFHDADDFAAPLQRGGILLKVSRWPALHHAEPGVLVELVSGVCVCAAVCFVILPFLKRIPRLPVAPCLPRHPGFSGSQIFARHGPNERRYDLCGAQAGSLSPVFHSPG